MTATTAFIIPSWDFIQEKNPGSAAERDEWSTTDSFEQSLSDDGDMESIVPFTELDFGSASVSDGSIYVPSSDGTSDSSANDDDYDQFLILYIQRGFGSH
jgi:hypothetical protein